MSIASPTIRPIYAVLVGNLGRFFRRGALPLSDWGGTRYCGIGGFGGIWMVQDTVIFDGFGVISQQSTDPTRLCLMELMPLDVLVHELLIWNNLFAFDFGYCAQQLTMAAQD
jgi:hypothetical protein